MVRIDSKIMPATDGNLGKEVLVKKSLMIDSEEKTEILKVFFLYSSQANLLPGFSLDCHSLP